MTSTTTSSSDPAAYVLYVDHQGHPAPLSECFHATASRRLSSTVDRQHRPSTVTQVDSAYCPQCLTFHDAPSATQLGFCPKLTCLQCPLCTSIVSCSKIDNVFCYTCGRCDWNSKDSLKVENTASDAPTKEEVANIIAQLSSQLEERRKNNSDNKAQQHYSKMIAAWERIVKAPSKAAARALSFREEASTAREKEWSVEALETAIQTKKEKKVEIVGGQELERISLETPVALDDNLQGKPVESLALQPFSVVSSATDLLPLPVPLRSRKSRRCRAELAEGKPGILLKPKLNPLEGDSSLRTGHGQWWKKDSSAVHVVPRVRVIRHGSKAVDETTQQHVFVLKVTNSTLGLVRLQIGLSLYHGEPIWDKDDHHTKNPSLENLLVETLSNKHVDAFLLTPPANATNFQSELVVLDSAEDSIVDIGKVFEVPEAVVNWKPEPALEGATTPEGLEGNKVVFSSIKLIAEKSGSAWFEFVCTTKLKQPAANLFIAIPISLQIEVGNGSWESSLIKANASGEDENAKDLVPFDLVLTWSNTATTAST